MPSVADKIAALRERIEARRARKQREQVAQQISQGAKEANRAQRREQLKEAVTKRTEPVREEVAKTKEVVDPVVVPGSQAAAKAGAAARAGGRKAVSGGQGLASAISETIEQAEMADTQGASDPDGAVERARQTAEAGAPVEGVSLSPAGNPRRQEEFGRGDAEVDDDGLEALVIGEGSNDDGGGLEGLVVGEGGGDGELLSFDADGDGAGALEFESDLLDGEDDNGGFF